MILAVISDVVWQATIGACVTIALALITRHEARKASDKVEATAEGVKNTLLETNAVVASNVLDVRSTLVASTADRDEKLRAIKFTAERTLEKVNGAMTVQLKLMQVTTSRLADLSKDPADIKAADVAATALADHETQMALASKPNTA